MGYRCAQARADEEYGMADKATASSITEMAELQLRMAGLPWLAKVEAQGGDHVRVRVQGDELGAVPQVGPGTLIECAMDSPEARYHADVTVLKQEGDVLWLRIPTTWSRTERRCSPRLTSLFSVSYVSDGHSGVGACLDISAGGMRLRIARTLPGHSRITLDFTLPGEDEPIRITGLVLYCAPGSGMGKGIDTGIKF